MKVGILTFHTAKNIGAQLQAFALTEKLLSLGHKVEIVRYEPAYLSKPYIFFRNVIFKNGLLSCTKQIFLHLIFDILPWIRTIIHYKYFRNNFLKLSATEYRDISSLSKGDYDALIVGSDQIWNPEITDNRLDDFYTLNFDGGNIRKISYAASFSSVLMSHKCAQELAKSIEHFHSVSVREKELKSFLSAYTNKKIDIVVDPTLLLDKIEWEKFVGSKRIIKEKYVLVYQARGAKSPILKQAKQLAEKYHAIVYDASGMNYRVRHNSVQYVNPIEFLNLVFYAEAIVTVSFHGTAISLILEKPFYSIVLGDGRDGRVVDLLTSVGLENLLVSSSEELQPQNIDFTEPMKRLSRLRQQSMQYIENALL